MKISVIMPIYNGGDGLGKSIDSALGQSYKNIELILINDGSTDHSLKVCQSYAKEDDRIIVINIVNSGPGAARNKGLDQATGDYISFLDADDWLDKNALETLLLIAAEKGYQIVSSNHYRVHKKTTISKNNYQTGDLKETYHAFKTSSSFGYVWGKLYSRSFLQKNKIRFTEEKEVFLEDVLFNLKAIAYHPKYYVLNKALYYYKVYDKSLSNKKEDISQKAIKLLQAYEGFLDENNIYNENLDLFVPLGGRVMAWSMFKVMEYRPDFKRLYRQVLIFSHKETVRRLFSDRSSLAQLSKLDSLAQRMLYAFMILCVRYHLEIILSGVFFISMPVFNLYIKGSLKS